jgi:hypothetical protein
VIGAGIRCIEGKIHVIGAGTQGNEDEIDDDPMEQAIRTDFGLSLLSLEWSNIIQSDFPVVRRQVC